MEVDEELNDEELEDYRNELCAQADFWGMESLTEDQQAIVGVGKVENKIGRT